VLYLTQHIIDLATTCFAQSALRPYFTPGNDSLAPIDSQLGVPEEHSKRITAKNNTLPVPAIELQFPVLQVPVQ